MKLLLLFLLGCSVRPEEPRAPLTGIERGTGVFRSRDP